ncbi:MAG: hypothetical protein LGR52_07530 [Candidatus Thiosymbion ectosymbiont of Robbea hypermnestra]|nr:hypothetical protein [Candidatus Thiosymbion ectosymbiont of Robbea hypermnestra]
MTKPTILIGHGTFGREVLERLLNNTAPRGSLEWAQAPAGEDGAGVGVRRLRDLALLWMPDSTGDLGGGLDSSGGQADFIDDLHRQIRTIENRPGTAERELSAAVAEASDALREPGIAKERRIAGGLDLVIVAHIDQPSRIGTLDTLTRALLKRLVTDNPLWKTTLRSKRKLSCVQVLDFDNYHRSDGAGAAVRRSLRRSMEGWKANLDAKFPAVDRCYLVDGRAQDSVRDPKSRYEEATLFIELLLFAGLRDHEQLRELYQQTGQDQQIAAAFGIRLLERSPPLLSRIAAASFGEGWLPYLRGSREVGFTRKARRVSKALQPFFGDVHEITDGEGSLTARWEEGVAAIREELLALPGQESEEWPERARELFARRARLLELELGRAGLDWARRVREEHLKDGGSAIEEAVTKDLHDPLEPVPLASVLAEIEEAIRILTRRGGKPTDLADSDGPGLDTAEAVHRAYIGERDEWLRGFGRQLNRLWPLLAGALALAITPFVRELLRWLPNLAVAETPWYQTLVGVVTLLDRPVLIAPMLAVLIWPLLRLLVQRRLTRGILRARAFHLDQLRGRLRDAILSDCDRLRGILDQVQANMHATLATELRQVLGGFRDRLTERGREIDWLRGQLGEFLRMQGFHGGHLEPPQNSAHTLLANDADLHGMMRVKPATASHFEGHQEELPTPFAGWNRYFSNAFLDLFGFVDHLSRPYLTKLRDDLSDAKSGTEWDLRVAATETFATQSGFDLTFRIDADKAKGTTEVFCVIPNAWAGQTGIRNRLQGIGVEDERICTGEDPSRVYLIKRHLNIPPDALGPTP